ncbi:MAG TPA: VWA domain-containing protein [Pyrinomonadaceae bacterium]|nr:VWA domain-containing protein [Pyrinomonadaceae bacterium]
MKIGNRFVASLFLLGLSLLLWASPASAQDNLPPPPPAPTPKPTPYVPKDSDYDVVRVTSNLVVVPVSVTNAAGEPVLGISLKEFRLEEEGRAQEITQLGDPEQVPLDIAILLDVSLTVDARFDFEKEAAARFIKLVMKPGDRATLFAIDTTPRLLLARETAERAALRLLSVPPAKMATAFYDTVLDAAQYLAKNAPAQRRRVIVVISDGEDTYSEKIKAAIGATPQERDSVRMEDRLRIHQRILQQVQREVQRAEATFYSINPSGKALNLNVISKRAQEGMEQISLATGGNSFVPERVEDLDGVFRQIAAELRSQYLLQYYSNDQSQSTNFRRIRVTLPARTDLRVRARQGYYPKSK